MSRLDPAQSTILKIEMITKSYNQWTKQEMIEKINTIIDKSWEQEV